MKYILIGLGGLVVLVLSSLWYGYVLSVVWAWFVVGAFHVSQISVPLAIGLSVVVNMFKGRAGASGKDSDLSKDFAQAAISDFLLPLFTLLFGYIIHLFV